ncbi:head maturation protease, ClpP-related [Oceanobacillus alkalisoli]|uniref:head maturation protease, ClpP-related n=1 Tax=Oceanobacillus alkalisoli TaxID=2925113 RepID=UPI001F11F5DD|nr:head maturation protease, ClpP-related [Oceanobacillus alkalisoli]MCF3941575.1 Clp protease ClpP [Oceanobacillus alkalisoli]
MKNINIKGPIVASDEKWIYEIFDIEATCPKDVTSVLDNANGEDIQLTINSPGGDVYSASEIYTELKDYAGNVESRIVGVAASAASVIAMAGKVKMSPTAQLMIHNASTIAIGDHNEMDKTSNFLKSVNKSISTSYQQKTGLNEEELLNLMDEETWMDAEEAKEKGFVDEIMFEDAPKAVASLPGALPKNVIDKMRTDALKQPEKVNLEDIRNVVAEMKQEIVNELKNEEKQKPVKNNWLF